MVGNIENNWLFFSSLITIIITVISFIIQKSNFDRFFILFFNISLFIYSGYGIAGSYIKKDFYLYFFVFLVCINFSYILTTNLTIKKNSINVNTFNFDKFIRNEKILKIIILTFFLTLILPLMFPNLRLIDLIKPPTPSTQQLFLNRLISNTNSILYIGKTIQLLLLPFFFIYIKKCIDLNKNYQWIILYFLYTYLKFLEFGYLSRNEMVGYICLFITMLMTVKSFKKYRIFFFIIILGGLILSVPFFVHYQESRIGGLATQSSYFEYVNTLLASEGFYPMYYNQIINMKNLISPFLYLLWLVFLIIPTKIFPLKPTLSINEIFTYQVTGMRQGDHLYSIQLPSLVGESLMIYGTHFFWIHAVFLGSFSAILFTLYKKYPTLRFWLIYLAISFIKIPRGGSQGFIAEALNGSVGLIIAFLIYNFIKSTGWRKNV
ncbi:hypothetical protein D920_00587 [Enterococcus faecalis 13-SD-W-01]|nr:hypothetical protein D920_00587 [Enterococcus faecalis 13-SD-W-01]